MAKAKVRQVPISELVPDPRNVRTHTKTGQEALGASVAAFGAARSIVVDRDGVVRAGNGTLEAARAAGMTEALVVEADGSQLVVVQRKDWSPEQATAYAIADNRIGELSGWDKGALADALAALDSDLSSVVGFSEESLAKLSEYVAPDNGPDDGPGGSMPAQPAAQAGFRYSVIVDLDTETDQTALLEVLEADGFKCRLMIS